MVESGTSSELKSQVKELKERREKVVNLAKMTKQFQQAEIDELYAFQIKKADNLFNNSKLI